MKNLKLNSCYALASAAVIGIAACSSTGDLSSPLSPSSPNLQVTGTPQTARVCKIGPVGSYSFTVSNSGTTNTNDVLVASPVVLNVTDPAVAVCTTVFTRTEFAGGQTDPAALIVITEALASGTGLQSIADSGGAAPAVLDLANRRITVGVNAFHSAKATFTNVAVGGCTFTQGWYKNHTSDWPAGALTPNTVFDGWTSLINVLNTPPKGSQYIILAHQYITALLNVQGGASVPPAVQTALNTAAAYFAGGGAGTGGNTDITGVAAILDDFNNGLTGPGHCD